MKGGGARMMLLAVSWFDSEWVSKLVPKIDKWVALIRSEELKKCPKICKHQPHPNLLQNFVYFTPKSYGFTAAWEIWMHNIQLNV